MCISGEILQGLKKPHDCPAFGKECTPRARRWARRWSPRRGPAPPTTTTAGCLRQAGGVSLRDACAGGGTVMDAAGSRALTCPAPIIASTSTIAARPRQRRPADRRADPARCSCRRSATTCWRRWRIRRRVASVGRAAPRLAFTTDSFVVRPLFFPGGDIGRLAVHGTVNDLAVGGARPLFLAAAFILEEGLPLADLRRIVASMRAACDEAGVALVTGDTKVVDRGKGDQVFITTTGIGVVPDGRVAVDPRRPARRPHPGLRARSATTASPSCRCARGSSSRRCWRATRAPLDGPGAKRCWRRARRSAACATRRAAACRAR